MDLEQVKILLERYNQGLCTPEEAKLVEQWFDRIDQTTSTVINETETGHQLNEIKSRIDRQIAPPQPTFRINRAYALPAIAAMLLIVAGIFWYNQRKQPPKGSDPIVQTTAPSRGIHTTRNGLVEITTPRTVKDTVRLPDGSTIVLNAGSRLHYPENFSNTERSISLEEGEAFFEVAHDPAHPFVVHTGPLTTTALGTSFNIRTYATENKVTVALFTGKVKIDHLNTAGNKASTMMLLPSEQVSFDRRQLSLRKTSFAKSEEVAGWKKDT
ncbi:FecR family protein [Paraflavitalea speifideaquila]|uniref:FecR family protein n=1 Tax=Paraflavitalea speifideaquila TaxID=3076558 RepID=UPI0028E90189|nr:FecR domain-containing protein [Paraflavitalea speifideiaquila]